MLLQEVGVEGWRVAIAKPVTFEMVKWGDQIVREPTFELSALTAQSLIDTLWDAGLRPTGWDKVEPSHPLLEAKDAHIADLRKIAFKGLRIG